MTGSAVPGLPGTPAGLESPQVRPGVTQPSAIKDADKLGEVQAVA